jgi:glycosyltransferase involved in cell wall biosynthesis
LNRKGSIVRVCHIIETSGGGSGQVVLDLLNAGIKAGLDQTVIYSPLRAEESFVEGVTLLGTHVAVHEFPMRREVGFHDIADFFKLLSLLLRLGPFDVVHSHSSKAGALARLAGPFLPRAAQVYMPHAFITLSPDACRVYGWIERFLSHLSDAIIAVSEGEKRHAIEKLRINKKKIHVVPNGIDYSSRLDRTPIRKGWGVSDEAFVLGFVGRLEKQKNPLRLVQAFAKAATEKPEMRLMIVGEGSLGRDVERAIGLCNMTNAIRLLGPVSGREVMAGFDALVCSSDYEAFPIVYLEALSAGVPILTTPVGGADETVVEGKTGFVSNGFAPSALSDAILRFASLSGIEREKMSMFALERSNLFGTAPQAERIFQIYADVAL